MKTIKEKTLKLFNYADELMEKGYEDAAKKLEHDVDELMHELNCHKEGPLKTMVEYHKENQTDKKTFEWEDEAANIVEKLIEMQGYHLPDYEKEFLKIEFKRFVEDFLNNDEVLCEQSSIEPVQALAGICLSSIGVMMKLGYKPKCVLGEEMKKITKGEFQIENCKKNKK